MEQEGVDITCIVDRRREEVVTEKCCMFGWRGDEFRTERDVFWTDFGEGGLELGFSAC